MSDLEMYCKEKEKIVDENRGVVLHGTPLVEFESLAAWKKPTLPFRFCICVKEPCPCDQPPIWFNKDDILAMDRSRKTGEDGQPLWEVKLKSNARILVEQVIPMTARNFESGMSKPTPGGGTTTAQMKAPPFGWVKAAFAAGFAAGTLIDKGTGLSDDIAEGAIDLLGPAPDWLQDLF